MKLVTSVKLTKKESISLAQANYILNELEKMLPNGSDLRETVEEAHSCLMNTIEELESMGNDFSVLPEKEEKNDNNWGKLEIYY